MYASDRDRISSRELIVEAKTRIRLEELGQRDSEPGRALVIRGSLQSEKEMTDGELAAICLSYIIAGMFAHQGNVDKQVGTRQPTL